MAPIAADGLAVVAARDARGVLAAHQRRVRQVVVHELTPLPLKMISFASSRRVFKKEPVGHPPVH